jgi:hypothetical protein
LAIEADAVRSAKAKRMDRQPELKPKVKAFWERLTNAAPIIIHGFVGFLALAHN